MISLTQTVATVRFVSVTKMDVGVRGHRHSTFDYLDLVMEKKEHLERNLKVYL